MVIREVKQDDAAEWLRMRSALYGADASLAPEIGSYFADSKGSVTLVAVRDDGALGGMIEIRLRDYAEGCGTSPVPYIEGWFVDADVRRRGIGRALVRAAEDWARARGYREIASDTERTNETSIAAHAALGYEKVEEIVCFRRTLR